MQIKLSRAGKTIQVLRAVYVPEKKRSTQLVVLTFPAYCDQVPESALEKVKPERKLTEDELKEVQAWLEKRKAGQKESRLRYSVTDLPQYINLAAEGLVTYGITNEQALAIYKSLDEIAKAIRKAGFTRPKKEPVLLPASIPKKKTVSRKTAKKAGKKKFAPKKKVKKTSKKAVKKVTKKTAKKSAGKKLKK